jgi:hypothetical protein
MCTTFAFGKNDDGVAVGVPRGEMQRADVLAVEMHRDVVVEGDHRQRALFRRLVRRLDRATVAGGATGD